ncbi:MAG: hypothetical protein HGB35_03730 [Geobacteraceae bacterium]|nr:hypothetical protein [Geobacteraceae bacterium]
MFCITAIYDGRRVLFSGEIPDSEQVSVGLPGLHRRRVVSTHLEFGPGAGQRVNLIYPVDLPPEDKLGVDIRIGLEGKRLDLKAIGAFACRGDRG